jgi:hypothetical protein
MSICSPEPCKPLGHQCVTFTELVKQQGKGQNIPMAGTGTPELA